jgi:chitodextrinase
MKTRANLAFAALCGALSLCLASAANAAEAPYGGTAAAIPGTVMAENYDTGGQGVAYNVTSTNGTANAYRSDGVDLETATAPATGNDLGWTAAGQWFRYTVNVSTAGTYTVSILVASPTAVADAFHLSNSSGTNLSGSVAVPATGGYQTWVTVTATVTLPAGTQTLTVNQDAAGWNVDTIKFAAVSSGEGPYGGTAAAIPGTVMAENYDTGGQGVGYSVSSTNGSANSYRSDGVDLEAATAPATGDDLGWTAAGQWFRYTVNVSTAGTYTVSILVASPTAVADGFHISNSSGTNLSGSVAVPATGGYQTWVTVTATVTLPAGTQTLTVNQDAGGWNIDSLKFASTGGSCTTKPSAPTGLAASGTTSTTTSLSWILPPPPANCSISSYTVLKNGASIGTATGNSFAVTGLTASTTYSFTVEATDAAGTSAASSAVSVTTSAATGGEGPYGGTPAAIPGTVMAENYDTGGQGVAYNVTSVNGSDNAYRSDGVDLETATSPATGNDLGWTAAGQWFRYTVNVSTAGTYTASFLVASPTAVGDAFHISNSSGTNLSGSVAVPATGGYQTWVTVTASITLSAGTQTLTVNQDAAGWNIDSMAFTSSGGGSCAAVPSAPTGLAASGTSSSGTTLNWTADTAPANCSISSYTVYENGAAIATVSSGTSYTVSGLSASTSYSFAVAASDAKGASSESTAVNVTTSAASGGGCAAAWVSTTAYTAGMEANVSGINYVANFWTEGNNPATSNGPTGSGQPWTSLGACSACTTVPSTPTGLADSGTTSSSTNLSWNASTVASNCSLSGYTIYRNGSSVGTTSSTSFTASGLSGSTSYTFAIAANDSAGASGQSSSVSVTTPACTGSCGSPGSQAFAPYMDISLGVGETVASMASQAGLKSITLAFLVDGDCVADWGGLGGTVANATFPNGTTVASAISALESEGVSIYISWGGAEGSIQSSCSTASQVQAMYQSVFNAYPGIAGQDFDIEGGINNTVVAQALAGLKAANPSKLLSLTLPVEPTGLLSPQLAIIDACKSAGFNPDVINGMAMDYGSSYDNGAQMGLDATDVASALNSQIQAAGLSSGVGVTPMIGVNDTATEIFQLADATTLVNFAKSNSYVKRLAMWSLARDNGGCAGVGYASATCSSISQANYAFSDIFDAF